MKIWQLIFQANDYENLETLKALSIEDIQSFDGRNKKDDWQPLAVRSMDRNKTFGDLTVFATDIPVVTPRVIEVTKDLIQNQAEVLPTICSDCEFYILNITNIVDAVDYTKAQAKYFPDGKRVLRFIKLAFIEEKVRGNHIFKLVEKKLTSVYVSDEFRQRIIDNNLTGFKFELVWDSEAED